MPCQFGTRLGRALAILYPSVMVFGLAVFYPVVKAHAGRIRTMQLTRTTPGKVYLALDHSTAISFPSKPERLVPGSPSRINVDFLGNDITVTPVARNPGNLIVYTKSGRYVILFEPGTASNYDDAVNIRFGGAGQPLRLSNDTYHATEFQVDFKSATKKQSGSSTQITALMSSSDRKIEGDELADLLKPLKHLQCQGCSILNRDSFQIFCAKAISDLKCSSTLYSAIHLKRVE